MSHKYFVVLFKNKVKKRIIKKFVTLERAKNFFEEKRSICNEVIFEKSIENGYLSEFELGLIEKGTVDYEPIYITDEFGRNVKAKVLDEGMKLKDIFIFKKEEKIYDLQTKKKVSTPELIKKYLVGQGVKLISSINNKIIIQNDDRVSLFSLKNQIECERFLDCLSRYFFRIKKGDCIIVKDVSTAQKKYLFKLMEESGFEKKVLYRKYTTYPRSK